MNTTRRKPIVITANLQHHYSPLYLFRTASSDSAQFDKQANKNPNVIHNEMKACLRFLY